MAAMSPGFPRGVFICPCGGVRTCGDGWGGFYFTVDPDDAAGLQDAVVEESGCHDPDPDGTSVSHPARQVHFLLYLCTCGDGW